jgi:hypothetical protein
MCGVREQKRFNTAGLNNLVADGGEVFSLMRRSQFTIRKIPGTHFG